MTPPPHTTTHRAVSFGIASLALVLALDAHAGPAHERVLALFEKASLVFLGERHLSKQDSDFRIALIKHPGFAERVGNVVIEFGNAKYQDVLDDFLLELKDVPSGKLNQVWRNTLTRSGVWDSPIYEAFLRTVRSVNEQLPRPKRIRVIAGDPPIDWAKVVVFEDMLPFTNRGWHAVRQVEREVLSKNLKALVIYGYGHFLRKDDEMDEDDNLLRRLESLYPDREFRVVVPFGKAAGEPPDLEGVIATSAPPAYVDATAEPIRKWNAGDYLWGAMGTLEEVVDGLIYFGAKDEAIEAGEEFYERHPEYQKELERRRGLRRRLSRPQSYN